jgi:hypothetical protein
MSLHNTSRLSLAEFTCEIYPCTALDCTSGAHFGDPIAANHAQALGDLYAFVPDDRAFNLVVQESGAQSLAHLTLVGRQSIATTSEIGTAGSQISVNASITLMGSDGGQIELLLVAIDGEDYFYPLAQLSQHIEYTSIATRNDLDRLPLNSQNHIAVARGTTITMSDGTQLAVQDVEAGMKVLSRGGGAKPVKWIGSRVERAEGALAPIIIPKGELKNENDLVLSPEQSVMLRDWRAEVMVGSSEVLVKARDLINDNIWQRRGGRVEYFSIVLDVHDVIYADGTPVETMAVCPENLAGFDVDTRDKICGAVNPQGDEIDAAFPALLGTVQAEALLRQVRMR